ncbi:hypothetical protein ACFWGP_05340 [Agromyces sp. NPDC127015]|uniref:phage tail protein n=1 Tax=Agromyces sp. NPDC127015 TaxID=3347108 RepID=UPI00364D472F
MAGGSPGAKVVGKVAIRAIPDTSKFRSDLRKKLQAIEKTASFRITVDRARVMRAKIRKDIQDQLGNMQNLIVQVEAHIRNKERFGREVEQMIRDAERNKVGLTVDARAAVAKAQLALISRDRLVELFVHVNKASLAKAATAIAALSGLRLAGTWLDDLTESMLNLDKNLPKIALATTSITSLVAAILGATSGLVGILAGLSAILPAFMVVPGALMNATAGITVFIVALQQAQEQLAPLAGNMHELADIIRGAFWSKARQPIIDLITNLMPQLRESFRGAAEGMGEFYGSLATSFEKALEGGRLDALFAGLGESMRILSTGTDAFAGAIVSLGEIGAQYMPRLSQWFVDLANRFDTWLKLTAEDGRMTQWIDGAIEGLHQLWDIAVATVDIFEGLWNAAEAAGGGGLGGFRDILQSIADTVNSEPFQTTLTAFFRGAATAMDGLKPALSAIGGLFHDLREPIEYFIGTAGQTFGLILSSIADALNTPAMGDALVTFIDGIRSGVEKLAPYLPTIVDGLATLIGFAGDLAAAIAPVAGAALALFAEAVAQIAEAIGPELPALTGAVADAIAELSPKLLELVDKLLPVLPPLIDAVVKLLPQLVDLFLMLYPAISGTADVLVGFLQWALTPTKDALEDFADFLSGLGPVGELFAGVFSGLGDIVDGGLPGIIEAIGATVGTVFETITAPFRQAGDFLAGLWGRIGSIASGAWQNIGLILGGIIMNIRDLFTGNFGAIQQRIGSFVESARSMFASFGAKVAEVVQAAISWFVQLPGRIQSALSGAGSWLVSAGRDMINGLVSGIQSMASSITQSLIDTASNAISGMKGWLGIHSPSTRMRDEVGRWMPAGIEAGIEKGMPSLEQTVCHMVEVPKLPATGKAGTGGTQTPLVGGAGHTINLINPVVRDLLEELREAGDLLGALG